MNEHSNDYRGPMGDEQMSNKKPQEEQPSGHESVLEKSETEISEPSLEEKLTTELKETHDRLLRVAAEFENYKKISQREQINSIKYANESLVLNLLPVIDNLEQAVNVGKKSDSSKDLVIGV
jgi:molecular chaperone GrpE